MFSRGRDAFADKKSVRFEQINSPPHIDLAQAQEAQTERRKPTPQPYYAFDGQKWQSTISQAASENHVAQTSQLTSDTFHLLTWNIDFQSDYGNERMSAALDYLGELLHTIPPDQPVVIFFQEMTFHDLKLIQATPWVQQRFFVTDTKVMSWQGGIYGTTTLVDKRLKISDVFRTRFKSQFQRDGLFVDVQLTEQAQILRLCNVHLESLVAKPPLRPQQLQQAASYMKSPDAYAAVLAGDCNAIQPFDRTLHAENGLKDAYLELGGQEDQEEGYTWGQQAHPAARASFGCSRMDKVMFCRQIEVVSLMRIGEGVKVEDETARKKMIEEGQLSFVTDHIGLMAEMELLGSGLTVHS